MKIIFIKYIFLLALFLHIPLCYPQSLTAEATDGDIADMELGRTYHCTADSASDELIIVPNSGWEEGTPLRIRLKGIPSSVVKIVFNLPNILTGDGGGSILSSWDSTGVLWRGKNRYVNPRDPFNVEIASDSSAVLDLGIILTIPGNTPNGLFMGPVIFSAIDTLGKDTVRVTAGYYVKIFDGIVIEPDAVNIENLSTGITYTLDPEKDSIQPVINGNERGSTWIFSTTIQLNAHMEYRFTLPDSLFLSPGMGIACSFASNSLYLVERNLRLNPDTSLCVPGDSLGNFTLKLGITIAIPSEASSGTYIGSGVCELWYCGMYDPRKKVPLKETCVIGFYIAVGGSENVPDPKILPTCYGIDQNYPNPFNPTTTIRYTLPKSSYVTLKVYDILGRELNTLVAAYQEAGYKSVQFNARDLPGGVYFYRLKAGIRTATKKLLLLK